MNIIDSNSIEIERKHSKKVLLTRLLCYFIYFLITHSLFLSFYLPLLPTLTLSLKISFCCIFYIGHILFFLLSFSNPGHIQNNFKSSFQYDENKKCQRVEESTIESQDIKNSCENNRRAKTEANVNTKGTLGEEEKKTLEQEYNSYIISNSIVPHHQRADSKNTLCSMLDKFHYRSNSRDSRDTIQNIGTRDYQGNNSDNNTNINQLKKMTQIKEIDKNKEYYSNRENESDPFSGNYCIDCLIDTPLRGRHCKECGKCIATFDHHCKWVGNCIGERNKKIFHLFLLYHSIIMGIPIVLNILKFEVKYTAIEYFRDNWIKLLNTLFNLVFFCFVFSLYTFQFKIMIVNQTSWENYTWHKLSYMRMLSGTQKSPFDIGLVNNIKVVLCPSAFWIKNSDKGKGLSNEVKKEQMYIDIIDWKKYAKTIQKKQIIN